MDDIEFNEEQLENFKEVFNLFDDDGSGTISIDEFKLALKNLGIYYEENELTTMLTEIDKDGNGIIEWSEFLILMKKNMKDKESEEDLLKTFKIFDTDCDGLISKYDVKMILGSIDIDIEDIEINEIFKAYDKNKDGFINFKEFIYLFNNYE